MLLEGQAMFSLIRSRLSGKPAWNRGKLIGQKPPLKVKDVWAIRVRLQIAEQTRDLALFNLAIDSKLRGCDLVALRTAEVWNGQTMASRTIVIQKKTKKPVQFEITEATRDTVQAWITIMPQRESGYLFPSRANPGQHLSTRQYGKLVKEWVGAIGLDPQVYGTHSLRRTKPTLIYRRTQNLRAVQLLLGHTKLESTVRYLGIEVDDALTISEQTEI